MARATWDTGWFQAEIYRLLLEELGYVVDGPATMENAAFYAAVADGTVDFWANGWFPLHRPYLRAINAGEAGPAVPIGQQVSEGALQGYLVDRRTAKIYGIDTLSDLQDPAIALLFDHNGNGKADLVGCNPDWSCADGIEAHLDLFGLRDTVEQIQGDYGPLMGNLVQRFQAGEPILFYTWTPNWTVGSLRPGEEVVWLQASASARTDDPGANQTGAPCVAGVDGCADDPCCLGWPPNDIRVVANRDFLQARPAAAHLLEAVEIPMQAIHRQNARMIAGEDSAADIRAQAQGWIHRNRASVNRWLATARRAGSPALSVAAPDLPPIDRDPSKRPLRIAARVLPPFVLYSDLHYDGFSVEIMNALCRELDLDFEVYAVNSVAKLLDEAARGAADVSLSAIAITAEREVAVDFTHSYFESGLQILVPEDEPAFWTGFLAPLTALLQAPRLLSVVLLFFLIIFVVAHVIWLIERRRNPQFPAGYVAGVFAGLWWAIVTVTTVGYGDTTPKANEGKLFALAWLLAGYFVFAYFTASVTATVTLSEIRSKIDGPDDLYGHRVGTVEGSTAEEFLRGLGIRTEPGSTIEDVIARLEAGELAAIVYHAPYLQYYARHAGRGAVRVSGPVFSEHQYGLALPPDSELREPLNRALLTILEDGTYQTIYDRWFER